MSAEALANELNKLESGSDADLAKQVELLGGPFERVSSAKAENSQPQHLEDLGLKERMMKDYGEFEKVSQNKGISSDVAGKQKFDSRRLQVNISDEEFDDSEDNDNCENEKRQGGLNSSNYTQAAEVMDKFFGKNS